MCIYHECFCDTLQVNAVLEQHERKAKQEYSNDIVYRRMVSESLQAVTMATSAMQVCKSIEVP